MRILLIVPPAEIVRRNIINCIPPLGVAYLAASLEKHGHEPRLLDCMVEGFHQVERLPDDRLRFGLSDGQIAEVIRREKPEVIGVSCPFSQMNEMAKRVLRIAKETHPEATTIIGGVHPSLFPDDALSEPAADIVFRGQGELALPILLDRLRDGKETTDIPGVVIKGKEGEDRGRKLEPPFLKNLDDLPFPAWPLLPIEKYLRINIPHGGHVTRKRVMPVLTSRGCPMRCTYCDAAVFWNHRIAYRSPRNVVDEIKMLRESYRVEEIHFEDDNLILHRERALSLFRLMAEEVPEITWNVPNGIAVANLDDEMLEAIAKSGCYELALAVESGVPRILTEVIGKTDYLDRLPGIVKTCKRLGIFVHGFFVVGWPGESLEEAKRTIKTPFTQGFQDATMVTWVPIPQTRLYETAIEERIIRPEDVGFAQIHMTARIPRRKGVPLGLLLKLISRGMWRIRLRLLLRNPKLFFKRFISPFIRNPGFGLRYVRDQIFMSIRPNLRTDL